MSTTPTLPAAPAAMPTPAPAATPSTAPVTPPAAPTPTPVATPSATSIPETPVAATPSGPQPPAKPNPKEFANASDWYMAESAYNAELEQFKAENPDVQIPEDVAPAVEPETPAQEAKPEDAQTETQQPEETNQDDSISLDDEPALTPQALTDLLKGKPEREEFLKNDPEFKNALYKLSREHAELVQFKGVFPTAESAKFARETANRT